MKEKDKIVGITKKHITVRLYPKLIKELARASKKTGMKKNTIVEQGIELWLRHQLPKFENDFWKNND